MMNCARRLLLQGAAAASALHKIPTTSSARYHHRAATAQERSPADAFLGSILRRKPPAVVVRPPTPPAASSQSPWYRDPRKVTAAGALVAAATLAATCRLERVPCSNRVHVVILSQDKVAESQFEQEKSESEIVDPHHPDSVRVRRIAERILHAAYRGLGVDSGRDAVMLRRATVGRKKARWWTLQPHTGHLGDGLEWEVVLRKDHHTNASTITGRIIVNTGLLDHFKTDAEIAFCLAHEIGHTIARHVEQITSRIPVPGLLLTFSRREELEADYIGMLLLGAAGFDPRNALVVLYKLARINPETVLERIVSRMPSFKKRLEHLSQANVMEEALELYREVIAMETVTDRYFSTPSVQIY